MISVSILVPTFIFLRSMAKFTRSTSRYWLTDLLKNSSSGKFCAPTEGNMVVLWRRWLWHHSYTSKSLLKEVFWLLLLPTDHQPSYGLIWQLVIISKMLLSSTISIASKLSKNLQFTKWHETSSHWNLLKDLQVNLKKDCWICKKCCIDDKKVGKIVRSIWC